MLLSEGNHTEGHVTGTVMWEECDKSFVMQIVPTWKNAFPFLKGVKIVNVKNKKVCMRI